MASSDKNWNLLESEDAGLELVQAIKATNVCDLSASRQCDGVTLLHVAAEKGYSRMLQELLQLQVKLEGNLIFLSSAIGEAHVSWYNRARFEAPLKPFGIILFLYLTARQPVATVICIIIC